MRKVIVVDDEFLSYNALKNIMRWENYDLHICTYASNGKEAREAIEKHSPDIAFIDVCMPVMDGIELLKYIKAYKKDIKCIMISSYPDYVYVREAMKLGACDYLLKHRLTEDEIVSVLNLKKRSGAVNQAEEPEAAVAHESVTFASLSIEQELALISAVYNSNPNDIEKLICSFYAPYANDAGFKSSTSILTSDIMHLFIKLKNKFGTKTEVQIADKIEDITSLTSSITEKFVSMAKETSGSEENYSETVRAAINFLKQHYREDIGLNDVSQKCHVNNTYLSHLFKKETGTGINQYLNRLRILQSMNLMLLNGVPATQAYLQAGFNNYNNFFNCFKLLTGVSPTAFIKNRSSIEWLLKFTP